MLAAPGSSDSANTAFFTAPRPSTGMAGAQASGQAHITAAVRNGVHDLQQQSLNSMTHAGPSSGFLSRSASANTAAADSEARWNKQAKQVYQRNVNSTFDTTRQPRSAGFGQEQHTATAHEHNKERPFGGHLQDALRDDSYRLVESLQVGPCTTRAPDDDLHFQRLEPNSGIPLRRRFLPHLELQAHLEGRCIVPINVLYSIAEDRPGRDGEMTVPIDGDWVVIGVLVEVTETKMGKAAYYDQAGKRYQLEEGEDHEAIRAKGYKVIQPPQWRTFTMIDLGKKLDSSGEHNGADKVKMTVLRAERAWTDESGARKYAGGSAGGFETLGEGDVGTVVCVMNAQIRKEKAEKAAYSGSQQKTAQSINSAPVERKPAARLFGLSPRGQHTIIKIGLAEDHKQCASICRDGKRCRNFVDKRTKNADCAFHLTHKINKVQNKRQEFASGTASLIKPMQSQGYSQSAYAFSDGMAHGPLSKQFVTGGDSYNPPAYLGSQPGEAQTAINRYFASANADALKKAKRALLEDDLRHGLRHSKVPRQPPAPLPPLPKRRAMEPNRRVEQRGAAIVADRGKETSSAPLQHNHAHIPNAKTEQTALSGSARVALRQILAAEIQQGRISKQDVVFSTQRRGAAAIPMLTQHRSTESGQPSAAIDRLLARQAASSSQKPKPILKTRRIAAPNGIAVPSVRPPAGASFYPSDDSDDEFDAIVAESTFDTCHDPRHASESDSEDSDIEIVGK